MTMKEYLAEVRERREENWQDTLCHEDIPRLIAIVEAQAEALEFYGDQETTWLQKEREVRPEDVPFGGTRHNDETGQCESVPITKPFIVKQWVPRMRLQADRGKRAREALAKAEAIAGGEG